MEFSKTIFQAWKDMEKNSQGHGKSWKMMMMSGNFLSKCTRIFVSVNIILFVVSLVLLTDRLTRNWKYIFILVSIHKSCIVYFEKIYAVPIGHGNSFFWSWKSQGKSLLKKSGHPVQVTSSMRTLASVSDAYALVVISKSMWTVKLCSNEIFQFLTGGAG